MDLRQLRHFVVLAEELHFGRAAVKLGIVQSGLTQSIHRLEASLNTPLLVRGKSQVSLTSCGHVLVQQALEILAMSERTLAMVHAEATAAVLRVSAVSSAQFWLTPDLIGNFGRRFPEARLTVREGNSGDQLRWLSDGQIDVTLTYLEPGASLAPGVHCHQLLPASTMYAAVPAGSALARQASVGLADLARHHFIWFTRESDPAWYDALIAACAEAGFRPHVVCESSSLTTLMQMVSGGMGLTLANRMTATVPVTDVSLVPVRDLPRQAQRDFVIAWRQPFTPLAQAFVNEAKILAKRWNRPGHAERQNERALPSSCPGD